MFVVLLFVNNFFIPKSSTSLNPIQAGVISWRLVFLRWRVYWLLDHLERRVSRNLSSTSEGTLCASQVIPIANCHIICGLKIFVNKIQGQTTYCVAGSMKSAEMPSSFLLVLFIRSTCIWLNSI